mgnify:CR=1 FL=1
MYTITNTQWSFKKIAEEMKKGTIDFKCGSAQRGYVWDKARQSLFVHSGLRGDIIPCLYIRRVIEKEVEQCEEIIKEVKKVRYVFEMRDGKQRCTTIMRYINNEFKTSGIPEYEEGDKIDYRLERNGELVSPNGIGFEDLTEDEKLDFLTRSITVYYIDNATDAEADMIFLKLNNGKALTTAERNRAEAKSRSGIIDIANHEVFKFMFSEKTLDNNAFDTVVKSYIMLNYDNPSLLNKDVKPLMKSIDITEEDKKQLTNVFDYILEVYNVLESKKVKKRIVGKTSFLSLIPVAYQALSDGKIAEEFASFLDKFFSGKTTKEPTISATYNENFFDSSASRMKIRLRHNALMNEYEKFFNGETENVYSENAEDLQEEIEEAETVAEYIDISELTEPESEEQTEKNENGNSPFTENETEEKEEEEVEALPFN